MDDTRPPTPHEPAGQRRIDRRRLLAQGAAAGAIVWAAPTIESVTSEAAAASTTVPTSIFVDYTFNGIISYYVELTFTGPKTLSCAAVNANNTTICTPCHDPFITGGETVVAGTCPPPFTYSFPSNYVVTVTGTASSGAYVLYQLSFFMCGSTCYRPTGNGSIFSLPTGGNTTFNATFNCAAPGTSCPGPGLT